MESFYRWFRYACIHNVTAVTPGTLTITQGNFYYKANPASYVQGDAKIDTDRQSGSIVNSAGKNMQAYLTDTDKTAYTFAKAATTTAASPVGKYAIDGAGIATNRNYKMADQPQRPENAVALDIHAAVSASPSGYEAAKQPPAPGNKFGQDTANRVSGKDGVGMEKREETGGKVYVDAGGNILREGRGAIRFVTIADMGINLQTAGLANTTVTVDAASRADGGKTAVLHGSGEAHAVAGSVPSSQLQLATGDTSASVAPDTHNAGSASQDEKKKEAEKQKA